MSAAAVLSLFLGLASALPSAPLHVRRKLLSQGTTYCYLNADGSPRDALGALSCDPEPTQAPVCVTGGTTALCKLPHRNGVDENRWFDSYAFDHCTDVVAYVSADGSERYYCAAGALQSTGDWSTRRRETAGGGNPESTNDGSWGCWWKSGYSYTYGKCQHRTRFLGETCADEVGICENSNSPSYSGLHLSCATVPEIGITTPTCIPSAFYIERNSCSCGWFDWWFAVACGAGSPNECNGHPCVFSTGPGGWMCDYNQGNDW